MTVPILTSLILRLDCVYRSPGLRSRFWEGPRVFINRELLMLLLVLGQSNNSRALEHVPLPPPGCHGHHRKPVVAVYEVVLTESAQFTTSQPLCKPLVVIGSGPVTFPHEGLLKSLSSDRKGDRPLRQNEQVLQSSAVLRNIVQNIPESLLSSAC